MQYFPAIKNTANDLRYDYPFSTSKIVCVGRNYAAHAKELNNPIPSEPLLFIKSTNALTDFSDPVIIPAGLGECHHELEVAILIGKQLSKCSLNESFVAIDAIGLALDLTLRDLQKELKEKGHPWEKAKSFDGACPITEFYKLSDFSQDEEANAQFLAGIEFSLEINGILVQQGNSKNMLFDIPSLVHAIAQDFTLYQGDIVLTGTPEGVGVLKHNDQLSLTLNGKKMANSRVHEKS